MIVSQICERYLNNAPQERRFIHLLERHAHDVKERYNAKKSAENRHDYCDALLMLIRVNDSQVLFNYWTSCRCAFRRKTSAAPADRVGVCANWTVNTMGSWLN